MFAYLDGKLAYKEPSYVIIDVNGVGYQVRISLQTYAALQEMGERCKLFTLLIVREDSHTLFGFSSMDEKILFEDLTSVSGIGPSIALVMLSSLSSGEIKHALITEDLKTIQSIKGIGLKTAQRAIIELKDKLKKDSNATSPSLSQGQSLGNNSKNEAIAALVMLGIPRTAAEKSVDAIIRREGNNLSVEQLIKLSLK